MITKKSFNPVAVVRYMQVELLFAIISSVAVYTFYVYCNIDGIIIPFSVAGILGSALAIFIAFRNNNAYSRWWEARTAWGSITNNSRIFARQILANTQTAIYNHKATREQIDQYNKDIIYRQIAFAHALRLQLRHDDNWTEITGLLSDDEWKQLKEKQNIANALLHIQGLRIREGIQREFLGPFDNISLEPTLAGFNNFQGTCERIRKTPLLRQYHFFTNLFLFVFMIVLPLSLIGNFAKSERAAWMIPVSVLVSFVFAVMAKVGEINEDPFENRITDVPMSAICNTIERDLIEMLGEKELPSRMEPFRGFLF